ncbi:MAG: glycoside hydrolase family 31 protein [Bacilli bacterium]
MYELGKHFQPDYTKTKTNSDCIIKGKKYCFSVLSESLIRFEYQEEGLFTDEPTQLVTNRNFKLPIFEVKQDNTFLEIKTSYFKVTYMKEKKINSHTLRVQILKTDKIWHYKQVEAKNYEAPVLLENGKLETSKSLYSLDGFVSIDDSKDKVLNIDGTYRERNYACLDIYLFVYNQDFLKCLKDYFNLTGYPSLIPRYALGNWWSRNNDYNDNDLKEIVDNFEKNKIPLSIVLLDKDWHVRTYNEKIHLKTGFTFNKELFASPYEMLSYLHSKGIRVGLNVNPTEGMYNIDEYFDQAKTYLKPDGNGVIPFNVLEPKWIDVYLKIYIHPLDALGVDFYWLDYFDKVKKEEMYLLKYYQFNDMLRNYQRRPMILGYNALVAQHRYPVLYAGKNIVSWESLKKIPLFNANAANIGVSWWSHDIGGYFKGTEDNELYIRYVQLGTFSPILKFGADKGKYYKREPWRWGIKTFSIVKDYLNLRHKLIPYLYSESYKYYKEGIPIINPIYYKAPEMYDDLLYCNEYYFGSQLFVCPIVSPKDYIMNRSVHRFYMPEGIWYDFVTGKKFPGNHNYVSFYKDQDYPVFAKAGSIIPMGNNENINDTTPPKNMEIHFFPGISNEYMLYEDDGISNLYKKGFYLLTKIEYNYLPNNYTVIIRALEGKSGIVPEYRDYKLIFRNTKKAKDVIVYEKKEQKECQSYILNNDFIVEVKNVLSINQLTINCKGKDIEIDAVHLINNDIEGILDDLQIETEMKEKIDAVLFSNLPIKKKRIAIRKLGNKGLSRKFVKLFLNLLEYIAQV